MKSKLLPDLQAVSSTVVRKLQQVNDSHDLFISRDQLSPLLHVTDLHAGAVFIH